MSEKITIWNRNFVLLAFANLLLATSFYLLLPILPIFVTSQLHADNGMVGLILAAYTISALLIRPFAGMAIDKIGRKTIYLISFLVFSLLFAGYSFATNIKFLLILRFIHGIAWGVVTTAGSTIIVDMVPAEKRGEGIGIFGLSMTIAMAIGPIIVTIFGHKENYHAIFFFAVAMSLVGWILNLLVKYPHYVPKKSNSNFEWEHLIETSILPLAFNIIILTMAYGGLVSFISLYSIEIGVSSSGAFFFMLALGIGLTRITSGRIFDLHGPRKIVIVGIILFIVGFPILALAKNWFGFLFSALLLGFGAGIYMPTFQAMVINIVEPHRRGAANSTLFTAFDIGIGSGMLLIGWFSDRTSISTSYLFCSILSFIGLIIFLLFTHKYYEKHHKKFISNDLKKKEH